MKGVVFTNNFKNMIVIMDLKKWVKNSIEIGKDQLLRFHIKS